MYNALPLENSEFDDDQDILLSNSHQLQLFTLRPPKQLLKWVGNKQRYACQIVNLMPDYRTYVEPFLGSGAVLGTLAPLSGVAGDILEPLVKIWQLLQTNPQDLLAYYTNVWTKYLENRESTYAQVKASYNEVPNPYDLFFLGMVQNHVTLLNSQAARAE